MSTTIPAVKSIKREWVLIDAKDKVLGRLATRIARILRGKDKPIFTPFLDTGDFVVVVNASKVRMTGRKLEQKKYRWHTGYPGGLKEVEAFRMLQEHPDRIIERSVRGMLPKGPLGKSLGKKLKVYAGPEHPHEAQQPEKITIPA